MKRATMRRLSGVLTLTLAWLIVQLPTVTQACSVCTAGRDEENAAAFLLSTIFMSLLPLIAIGTLVYVLWRRIQKLEAETAPISSTTVPRTEP
jgi:hypothetical protein